MLLAIFGALLAFVAIATQEGRRRARVAGSVTNLQQFASGASSFAADNDDRVFSFSWRQGEVHVDPDGYTYPPRSHDNEAAGDQAVSIMRQRAGRPDITIISGWAPHIVYNYLALVEYLDQALPVEFAASPSDHNTLAWQRASRDPADRGAAFYALPNRPGYPSTGNPRWAFASSYRVGPSFFSPDAQVNTPTGPIPTFAQDPAGHRYYQVGSSRTVLGMRRMNEVVHPANKAMVFEAYADDTSDRRCFYAYERTRAPILLADGSVSVRSMSDANRGFYPNTPSSPLPTRINYTPDLSWEAPTLSGAASQLLYGYVQWTRSGLRGRDFGGPEVPWVP